MRRCLLIVLLLWLPLQFSWAAAAGYCRHEQRNEAAHFGHHAHQHDDDQPDPGAATTLDTAPDTAPDADPGADTGAGPDTEQAPSTNDLDCSACQSSCAQPLLPASLACHAETAPNTLSATVAQGHSLPFPALIERPKWTLAA